MLKKAALLVYIFLQTFIVFGQNTLVKSTDYDNFRTGLELLDQKKYGAARAAFEGYVHNHPEGDLRAIDAEYYIAYSALNLFNPDAEDLFLSFIHKYPYHTKSSTAYYDLGSFYYNSKKYEKAIEYLQKTDISHLAPAQQVEAKFRLAYSYFSQKDFDKSGKLFNEIKNADHKYTYAANYYAAFIEYKNDEFEAALADLKKAEKSDTYKPMVPLLVINVYYKQGKYDELLTYSEEVLKRGDKLQGADEIFLLTAEAYFMKKNYAKAGEYFKKYLAESKAKSQDIQYRMAFSEYKAGEYENAIKDFKNIASPKDSLGQASLYYLGLSYLKTNNKTFALAAFDQARKANFNREIQEEALFNYGKINFDLEKYNEGLAPLKEFAKLYPKSDHMEEAHDLLSESFLRTSNYSEAIAYIEGLKTKSVRVNTAYQRVTFYKGIELFNSNKFSEAIAMFDKSLQYASLDPEVALDTYFWKGEAYSILKEYENALKAYQFVLQRSNTLDSEYYLKVRYGIGYAYYNTKQYDKALPHFKEYVNQLGNATAKQNYDDALLRLADLYYVTKKYSEAVKYYDLAIVQKNVDMDYAYYQKGLVLGLDNKSDNAKQSFDQVIKNYPNSIYYDDAVFQKAQLDLESSNYASAADGFSIIINTKSGSAFYPYALLKRAIAYNNLKKYEEAIKDYKTLLDKYPAHEEAHNAMLGLQEALSAVGREEEFKDLLAKVKSANPTKSDALANVEYENAKSLYNAEKYKQAIEAFNSYLTSYPGSLNAGEINYYLAESYFRLKENENALKYYKAVVDSKTITNYNRAIQRIAEIEFQNKSYANAKNYYVVLLANAKSKKEKFTSWVGLLESYYKLSNYDSANFYAAEILNHGNASIDAENKALLYQGKVAYDQQQYEKATDFFINTLNSAKDENGAEAQYLMGDIQYKQQKYKQSVETLFDLNNNFSAYPEWVSKSYLLIAENYMAQNETLQAKATLNYVIEKSSNKDVVDKAKERLEELEKQEKSNEQ